MDFMQKCLLQQNVGVNIPDYYDHRYFFVERNIGNYVCGLARETIAPILFQHNSRFFLDLDWITAISKSSHNPSVLGFLVEQSCLAEISRSGLRVGDVELKPEFTYTFDELPTYDLKHKVTLYIPSTFNFKAIDGMLLSTFTEKEEEQVPVMTKAGNPKKTSKGKAITETRVVGTTKCAHLIPIQITISRYHSDSVKKIFDDLDRYSEKLKDYDRIDYSFLWIKEDGVPSSVKHAKDSHDLRGGQILKHPEFTEHTIPVAHISTQISKALQRARGGN